VLVLPSLTGRNSQTRACCGDGALRIFFVAQRDAGNHFAVGRLDDVYDFAAWDSTNAHRYSGGDCFNLLASGD